MSLGWIARAKCRHHPPHHYWTENLTPGREHIEARLLCAGCPVIAECGADVLARIDVGEWIDGLWVRQSRQVGALGGVGVDRVGVVVGAGVDVVPHSGVVRAGVILDWDGTE